MRELMNNIYDDFSEELLWIKKMILKDGSSLPDSLQPVAKYYTTRRLIVLPGEGRQIFYIDPELGRPIPYIVFWFADALGLTNKNVARRLALGLLYATLAYVTLDDIIDEENKPAFLNVSLGNFYLHRYLATFDGLFDESSNFWYYLADSSKKFMKYLYEDFTFKHEKHNILDFDPFSEWFLFRSCKSYSILVMSIFAAIAYATNNETKIQMIDRFWTKYAMAHRLHDDLNDWMEDLKMDDLNHSPILIYALQNCRAGLKLSEKNVYSMFLCDDFVNRIYDVIFNLIEDARTNLSMFNGDYLSRYMDEQVRFHTRNREGLLKTNSFFQCELKRMLSKE